MPEHILFLTGRLAEKNLRRVLEAMQPAPFTHSVLALSLQVAGLMTTEMIQRRVSVTGGVNRVMVPGRCRGDLTALSAHFGVPFVRGPEEIKDLPRFFGREAAPIDLSRHDVRIFAEIVDAPIISLAVILERAKAYQSAGADVVDLGCLPQTPFAHLEDAFAMLHAAGFVVSVDSMDGQELLRAGRAGADFLLSLKEETLWIADEVAATPSDMASLYRAIETMERMGRDYLADPIIEPIHFGFVESLLRYRDLRRQLPDVKIMMGTGNLTELTEADTIGMQALLMGIISELRITNILTTQISAHACGVIREADRARTIKGRTVIVETIITTRDQSGADHIAPMGIRHEDGFIVLSPFRPSATLEHVLREQCAVINYTDDVRIFSGCRKKSTAKWPISLLPSTKPPARTNAKPGAV